MKKTITIEVREDFTVPDLFLEERNSQSEICVLRENALMIGSRAVEDLIEKQVVKFGESLKLQEKHDAELRRLEAEKEELTKRITIKSRREADEEFRAALLREREKFDENLLRVEKRHSEMMGKMEDRHDRDTDSLRKTYENLKTEHEGLVIKLMSRLEPAPRGGIVSASLGRAFEENVERHLRQAFGARSGFHVEDVHATGHSGDLLMVFDGLRILIELKSYDPKTRVPTKEVEKLARDLAEIEPKCQAAIMISACSEITGHYSCGPLEVSLDSACVPVLFINNFLSLGEPQITLHMTRVFLSMIKSADSTQQEVEETPSRLKRCNEECARRCTGYLTELNRQSTDLLRQVTVMKNSAIRLRETVISLVENETVRFGGIIHLMTHGLQEEEPEIQDPPLPSTDLDRTVFSDAPQLRELALAISSAFEIGDHRQRCSTKDLLTFIQENMKITSEKAARDTLKAIFLESVVKHGYVQGVYKSGSC